DRLFGQVAAADPRNAIAVVGLARTADRRGDGAAASAHLRRALEIDPEDAAARRLLGERSPAAAIASDAAIASGAAIAPLVAPAAAPSTSGPQPAGGAGSPPAARRRTGFIGWLVRLVLGHD